MTDRRDLQPRRWAAGRLRTCRLPVHLPESPFVASRGLTAASRGRSSGCFKPTVCPDPFRASEAPRDGLTYPRPPSHRRVLQIRGPYCAFPQR